MKIPRPKPSRRSKPRATLTPRLEAVLRLSGIAFPPHACEFRFHRPKPGEKQRQWRFDVCWPERRVAVELEGGIWSGGAHTRGKHFKSDVEKYNAATQGGWRVLRYTGDCLEQRPMQVAEQIAEVLGLRR